MSVEVTDLDRFRLSPQLLKSLSSFQPSYTNYLSEQTHNHINSSLKALEEARNEKEAEELRRHNEIVDAVRELNQTMKETVLEAIKMGASVNIDSNTGNINISMNSSNVNQEATQNAEIDYAAAEATLKEISEFFDMPKFAKDFGEQAEEVKNLVTEILIAIQEKQRPGLIKTGLNKIKTLAGGVTGSLIASAIFEGIKKISGLF